MISNKNIKYIRSLHTKKFRDLHKKFIAEGEKITNEIVALIIADGFIFNDKPVIYATKDWINQSATNPKVMACTREVSYTEIKKMSALKTPQQSLAVIPYFQNTIKLDQIKENISIVLDNIQDPGNLGTIMRTSNWFGIKNIICSEGSVDKYNPKVVQASMGSIFSISVHYLNLHKFLQNMEASITICGTYMKGENIFQTKLPDKGLFVFGNESKGINEQLSALISKKISIPGSSINKTKANSLNISIAHAIVCSELSRKGII